MKCSLVLSLLLPLLALAEVNIDIASGGSDENVIVINTGNGAWVTTYTGAVPTAIAGLVSSIEKENSDWEDEFRSEIKNAGGSTDDFDFDFPSSMFKDVPTSVQSLVAAITSDAASLRSSIESELKTASGSRASSLSAALAKMTADVETAQATTTSTGGGVMPTAAVAMGALFGGAAVFANM